MSVHISHCCRSGVAVTSEVDVAYVAGLIDGDGCIRFQSRKKGRRRRQPEVSVSNNCLDVLKWLEERFGGRIYCERRRGRRLSYSWRVFRKDEVRRLLVKVLPYLKVRRRQAELVLYYLENDLPVEELEKIHEAVHRLNNGGDWR